MHISLNLTKTLFFITLCFVAFTSPTTPPSNTNPPTTTTNPQCTENGFYDCECAEKCLPWHPQDSISIYVVSGISLSICLCFLIAYAWDKSLRRKPNSLVLVLALACIVSSVNLLIQVTTPTSVKQRSPHTCNFESYISIISSFAVDIYILMLLLYSLITLKGDPQKKPSSAIAFHGLAFIVIGLLVYGTKQSNGLGKTVYGFCGFKPITSIYMPFCYYGTILFLMFVMILVSNNARKNISRINRSKKALLKTYLPLFQWALVIFLLEALNEIMLSFYTDKYSDSSKNTDAITGISFTTIITDLSNDLLPIMFVIACWRGRRSKKEKNAQNNASNNIENVTNNNDTKYESLLDSTYTSVNDSDCSRIFEGSAATRAEKKIRLLYSLMAGYHLAANNCETKEVNDNISINISSSNDQKIVITDEAMKKRAPLIYQEVHARRNKFAESEVKSYSVDIFENLVRGDKDLQEELRESMNFTYNHSKILEYAHRLDETDSEFFATRDDKFYFKVITESERIAFVNVLGKYVDYINTTPESLLMRVYGVYKLKLMGSDDVYDLALIRRVCDDSEMIARYYELQGTTLNTRKVDYSLEERNAFVDTMKIEGILKDVQFDRVERKLRLYPDTAKRLCDVIYRDIQFLYSVKLRGYHVALYIIDDTYSTRDLPLSMIQELEEEKEASSRNISVLRRAELELMSRNSSQESREKMVVGKKIDYGRFESITEGMYYKVGVVDFFHITVPKRNSGARDAMNSSGSKPVSSTMPVSDKDFGERIVKYIRKVSSSQ